MNTLSFIRELTEDPNLKTVAHGIAKGDVSLDHLILAGKTAIQVGWEASRGLYDPNIEQNDFSNHPNRRKIDAAARENGQSNIGHVNTLMAKHDRPITDLESATIIAQMASQAPGGSMEDLAYEYLIADGFRVSGINNICTGVIKNRENPGSGNKEIEDGMVDLVGFAMHAMFAVGKGLGRGFINSQERLSNPPQGNQPSIMEGLNSIREQLKDIPRNTDVAQSISFSKGSFGNNFQLNPTTQNSTMPFQKEKFFKDALRFESNARNHSKNDVQQEADQIIENLFTEIIKEIGSLTPEVKREVSEGISLNDVQNDTTEIHASQVVQGHQDVLDVNTKREENKINSERFLRFKNNYKAITEGTPEVPAHTSDNEENTNLVDRIRSFTS
ncbi:TPA: hypothetical protein KKW64_001580 [Legionella pneumophila]|nr:hypothetical protein [Legionella pneumophila]